MIKILIATPVHEDEQIFKLHLESIRNLQINDNIEIHKLYILHNCENLKSFINQKNEVVIINNNNTNYKKTNETHFWEMDNFKQVVVMKNFMIQYMLDNNFDYIFYIDSDLILNKKSLLSLLNADKDMISNIFWTKWTKESNSEPNCWDYNHYDFNEDTMQKLESTGYFKVGMTGACTLIKRKVFENTNVDWKPIYNLPMTIWEDRAFCIKVASNNFEIWTDTHYPALHLYRDTELKDYLKLKGSDNIE